MRIALLVIGALLVADAAFAACAGSWNLGAALPAILGLPLLAIGLFYEPMQALFATGAGRVLKWLLVGGYAAFFAVFAAASVCIASYSARPPQPGADAVIVLGCALRGREPSPALAARLDVALDYLAENPQAKPTEAIQLSRQMMNGNKWRCFVLDLTLYLHWAFLPTLLASILGTGIGMLTGRIMLCQSIATVAVGLLSLLFVNGYKSAAYTALYAALRQAQIEADAPLAGLFTVSAFG